MEFKMHESGPHCYNPNDKAVVPINNFSKNNQGFYNRQINDANQAKTLYEKLGYPPVKDLRWIFKAKKS